MVDKSKVAGGRKSSNIDDRRRQNFRGQGEFLQTLGWMGTNLDMDMVRLGRDLWGEGRPFPGMSAGPVSVRDLILLNEREQRIDPQSKKTDRFRPNADTQWVEAEMGPNGEIIFFDKNGNVVKTTPPSTSSPQSGPMNRLSSSAMTAATLPPTAVVAAKMALPASAIVVTGQRVQVNPATTPQLAQVASTGLTQKEKEVLAYTLLGEAANQGERGMAAVMHVIKNRAESGRYPDNLAAVALQHNRKGVYAFSAWNDKSMDGNNPIGKYSKTGAPFKQAMAVVDKVLAGELPDETLGATHYTTTKLRDTEPAYWWDSEARRGQGEIRIGDHVFISREVNPATMPEGLRDGQATRKLQDIHNRREGAQMDAVADPLRTPGYNDIWPRIRERPGSEGDALPKREVELVTINPQTGMPYPPGGTSAPNLKLNDIHQQRERQQVLAQTPRPGSPTVKAPVDVRVPHLPSSAPNKTLQDIHDRREFQQQSSSQSSSSGSGHSSTIVIRKDGTVVRVPSAGSVTLPPGVTPQIPKIVPPAAKTLQDIHDREETRLVDATRTETKQTFKTITVEKEIQVLNPEWGKVNPVAVKKLQDIHDKEDERIMAAQGIPKALPPIPKYITKKIMVEKKVPVTTKIVVPYKKKVVVTVPGKPAAQQIVAPAAKVATAALTKVQQAKAQGMSSAQAYAYVNAQSKFDAQTAAGVKYSGDWATRETSGSPFW